MRRGPRSGISLPVRLRSFPTIKLRFHNKMNEMKPINVSPKLGPFEIIGSMNRKLLVLLALLVIVGIVAYRTLGGDFNWELFFSSLRDVKLGWLSASVVLTLTTYLIRAMRWQVLLAPLKSIRIQPLFWTTIVGFSGIYVLGRAGGLVRP